MLIFGVVASGCDWSLFGYDAANTRNSPDTGISTSNVGSLTESWTHSFGTTGAPDVIDPVTEANGVVYATSSGSLPGYPSDGTLAAFNATTCPRPTSDCTPEWVAPIAYGNLKMAGAPIVADGEVYVSNRYWQAAFSTDDSGCSARVSGTAIPLCGALRIYDNNNGSGASSPLVVNNLLYATGSGKVFSANGPAGCADKPGATWLGVAIPVCEALWTNLASTGSTLSNGGTPTVVTASAGPYKGDPILYLAAPSTSGNMITVFAYDANGNNNCGVYYLKFCTPLWTDQASGSFPVNLWAGAVSVANGYAYVGGENSAGQGTLFAFNQNGINQNGTSCALGICPPVFQTSGGPGFPDPVNLAVSGSTVYGTGSGGGLFAFDGAGCGPGQASCTGALWNTGDISADGGGNLPSIVGDNGGPNVSNGVVYVGIIQGLGTGGGGGVDAFNSTSGTLIKSYPSPDNGAVYNSPIVANGVLYFGTVNGSIYAYAPPS